MTSILFIVLIVLSVVLWIWSMLDIAKRHFKESSNKTTWRMIVLFFPILGSFFYLQLRNRLTTDEGRKFRPKFNRDYT